MAKKRVFHEVLKELGKNRVAALGLVVRMASLKSSHVSRDLHIKYKGCGNSYSKYRLNPGQGLWENYEFDLFQGQKEGPCELKQLSKGRRV